MHPRAQPPPLTEEDIFDRAVELPPEERGPYVVGVCEGDPALRGRIELLLRLAEEEEFMGEPATGPTTPRAEGTLSDGKLEQPGEKIGPYKLLEQIGEGGFGMVWVAEQEKPMRRRVALKIIKLGMDTRAVIARFEQERQALAMMDHPNIARVLDAGATSSGRPYFAMELVRGTKITDYCDHNKLPTADRLRLFIAVCNAVQHAHQKGIIHRDLKPSNILVTLHDGVPVPKVIDFGVAKATQQQRLTDLTVYTQFEQMIGTPLYMSPEQAEMSGLDIDTRSDIYSLGVLLYELLVGRTPFDPQELMKAGFDEMRRVIREKEPERPSTFLSTMAVEMRTSSAHRRQTDSAKWLSQIRGDLDWIVMRALEKDRTRRYDTANSFAFDIERHLRNEPVQARPPTALYRFRRMVQRNRLAFAAGTGMFLTLLIGLSISLRMFIHEKLARERATAAEKSERQSNLFLKEMLEGVQASVALGRDTTMLRDILDRAAERVGTELRDQPESEAALREVIGRAYSDLAEYDRAETMFRGMLALLRKLHSDSHPSVAVALTNLGQIVAKDHSRLAEAEQLLREALIMNRSVHGIDHQEVAATLSALANVVELQGRSAQAEAFSREALALAEKLEGDEHAALAVTLGNLPLNIQERGTPTEAELLFQEALGIKKKKFGSEHPEIAFALVNLAGVFTRQGRFNEAEMHLREALVQRRKFFGHEHPLVAITLNDLGLCLSKQGKLAEAEESLREAVAITRKRSGKETLEVATSLMNLADVIREKPDATEAEAMYREALEICRNFLGNKHRLTAISANNLGILLWNKGDLADAEPLLREAVGIELERWGNKRPESVYVVLNLIHLLTKQDKFSEAETVFREALEGRLNGVHAGDANTIHSLAHIFEKNSQASTAGRVWREELAIRKEVGGESDAGTKTLYKCYVKMLRSFGKLAEIEALYREKYKRSRQSWGTGQAAAAVIAATGELSAVLREQGKWADEENLWRDALSGLNQAGTNDARDLEGMMIKLADAIRRQGRYSEAEPLYRQVIESRRARSAPEDISGGVSSPMASLGRLLTEWAWVERNLKPNAVKRANEAVHLLRDSITMRLSGPGALHWRTDEYRSRLGAALFVVANKDASMSGEARLAMLREAEALLLGAYKKLTEGKDVEPQFQRDALVRLVRFYQASDRPEIAAEWQEKLDSLKAPEAAGAVENP